MRPSLLLKREGHQQGIHESNRMEAIGQICRWLWLITILWISKAFGLGFHIEPDICDRVRGGSILIEYSYDGDPVTSVTWSRPFNILVGSCRPKISCATPPGYTLSQDGFNYSIAFDNAADSHVGNWEVADALYGVQSILFTLTENLRLKTVTFNDTSSTAVMVSEESPQSITCYTECLDQSVTNATLSFVLENSTEIGIETTRQACTGSTFGSTNTITLDTTLGLTGNKSLCYKLTSGQCSFIQPTSDCITVVFPLDIESDIGYIVVLAFGCTLLVISVGILIGFVCQKVGKICDSETDCRWKNGKHVNPLLGISVVLFLIVIVLSGVGLGLFPTPNRCTGCLYSGIANLVVGIILLIVAVVIYAKCFGKKTRSKENATEMDNGKPSAR